MHTMPAPGTRFRDFLHHSPTGGQRARVVQARRETHCRRRNSLTNASDPPDNNATHPRTANHSNPHARYRRHSRRLTALCSAAQIDGEVAAPLAEDVSEVVQHHSAVVDIMIDDLPSPDQHRSS